MTLTPLFKRTSTGAIQRWCIEVFKNNEDHGVIKTSYGQVDGATQTTEDIVKEGKNTGKKNATTPYEQACKEAEALWTKQKSRKGYVEDIERAKAGEDDQEGGIVPMLAHRFDEHAHKIKYPAFAQPKFDGIRCIAVLEDGKCTLWSRSRKPITGVPHIQRAIERLYFAGYGHARNHTILDGELYNHQYKDNFEQIVSYVRQKEPKDGHEVVEYHVYDYPERDDLPFTDRFDELHRTKIWGHGPSPLQLVETIRVENETELMEAFRRFRDQDYEGAMVRNAAGLYVNKRSYDLQKIKEFVDGEFEIIGFEEGRGKLMGHVASFVCKMADGKEFKAKMEGETERLKSFFDDHSLWKGRQLVVEYQNLTADGVPRFPIGKRFRDAITT